MQNKTEASDASKQCVPLWIMDLSCWLRQGRQYTADMKQRWSSVNIKPLITLSVHRAAHSPGGHIWLPVCDKSGRRCWSVPESGATHRQGGINYWVCQLNGCNIYTVAYQHTLPYQHTAYHPAQNEHITLITHTHTHTHTHMHTHLQTHMHAHKYTRSRCPPHTLMCQVTPLVYVHFFCTLEIMRWDAKCEPQKA